MKLFVEDAARLLNVSEETIYRWIKEGAVPANRLNDQYRFNRAELLEWATARQIPFSPEILRPAGPHASSSPRLTTALRAGGIHHGIDGVDKAAVLRRIVEKMCLRSGVDRDLLHDVLLARESLGSTAIGDGIAIPHVRKPVIVPLEQPMIAACFLERPVRFGAVEGDLVHAVFTLVSPTVGAHLHLLSSLSLALLDPSFKETIVRQATPNEVIAAAERWERVIRVVGSDAR